MAHTFEGLISGQPNAPPRHRRIKAAYVRYSAISSAEDRATILGWLAQGQFTDVFLEIYQIGTNHGNGTQAAYEAMLTSCTGAGYEVHTWILSHRRPYPEVDPDEEADYEDANERTAQQTWVQTIVDTYGTHIHADYLRYPSSAPCNEDQLGAITTTLDLFRSVSPGLMLSTYCSDITSEGCQGVAEYRPQWWADFLAANPSTHFNICGEPNPLDKSVQNRMKYQQDPRSWLLNRQIDFFVAQGNGGYDIQGEDWNIFFDDCKLWGIKRMLVGVGYYASVGYGVEGYIDDLGTALRSIHTSGLRGVALYQLGHQLGTIDYSDVMDTFKDNFPV
jgi:hypothetical protein